MGAAPKALDLSLDVKNNPTLFPILRLGREKIYLQGRKVGRQYHQVNQAM